jgi:hypothetical protein
VVVLGSPVLAAEGGDGWEPLFEEGGLTAWQKPIPGYDLPLYRASGVLDEDMYEILAVLNDFSRHREWMVFLTETRVVWRPDDFNLIAYVYFDAPWPVWDRDGVMRVTIDLDREREEVTMRFTRIDLAQEPPREGVIRVPRGEMGARLRNLGGGRTEVEAQMSIDMGGDVPRWLVRWFSRRVPLKMVQRIRAQVKKTRGQYADFIRKYDPRTGAGSGAASAPP